MRFPEYLQEQGDKSFRQNSGRWVNNQRNVL